MADGAMRLDRFLWWARLAKTRSAAQAIVAGGHLRLDGRVVDKSAAAVRVGNVLTYPAHGRVRVVRVEALPARRGPALEAQGCYTDLSPVLPLPVCGERAGERDGCENVSQQSRND